MTQKTFEEIKKIIKSTIKENVQIEINDGTITYMARQINDLMEKEGYRKVRGIKLRETIIIPFESCGVNVLSIEEGDTIFLEVK